MTHSQFNAEQPVRYLLIACGVMKREVAAARADLPSEAIIDEIWLEQGLHRDPVRLNTLVSEAVSEAEGRGEAYDAVLFGYGVCSGGTLGIASDRYRIVIPRAHDCITLFLGSKDRYLEEFTRTPGTYWFTPGFVEGAVQPGMSEKYAGVYHEYEQNYEDYRERFGDDDLARYVVEHQEQAWIKNYSRGTYVESGLPGGDAVRRKAQSFCTTRNWLFEDVPGDLNLIRDLLAGSWDPDRFLVLEPGNAAVLGGVSDIITVAGAQAGDDGDFVDRHWRYRHEGAYHAVDENDNEPDETSGATVIGIDAGGTYTDAVIVSLGDRRVLASAKSPTTHHDLAACIRDALEQLPAGLRSTADRVAISTTLATNAIVEGRGARTGLLLIGYPPDTAARVAVGAGDSATVVPGCHDIHGTETEPLDEPALIVAASELLARGVEALAVSSYLGVRNPDHELRAQALLGRHQSLPVVTGHELSDDLDAVRRAETVLLNARLLPIISRLVVSVRTVVADLGLAADIRLVTTEGTTMNTDEALEQPVRLVLSGPAASVGGVRFLTGTDDCLVADIGGTTTDITLIENGAARRTGRGATVGGFRTSIRAVDIRTSGLGGDSEIGWLNGTFTVGPRRIMPFSLLAAQYPDLVRRCAALKHFIRSDYGLVQPGRHYVLERQPGDDLALTEREQWIVRALENGPLSIVELAERIDYPYYSLLGTEHLENLGIVRASGLTPTDLLVADKRYDGGDPEAARVILDQYVERTGLPANVVTARIWETVHRALASALIAESLAEPGVEGHFPGCSYCQRGFTGAGSVEVNYRLGIPLIGIGAPAPSIMDDIGQYLEAETIFPIHHEVANAVGAAAAAGGTHLDLGIMPDEEGRFVLYAPDGIARFRDLASAREEAHSRVRTLAAAYAGRMGYDQFTLDVHLRDRTAPTSGGGSIYLDTAIVGRMRW
jgi:N-methylhydantoinase A/oxoprolinase/acetone carboxylase beta subunit